MLVLAEGPTNGLNDTAIIEDDKYSVNITKSRRKFWWIYRAIHLTGFYILMV